MSSPIVQPSSVQDITSARFNVNDVVNVRCTVVSIVGEGAGATVNLLVETPGLVGQKSGVTLAVSPVQCRKATASSQLSGN
jgi:hypothetical protein